MPALLRRSSVARGAIAIVSVHDGAGKRARQTANVGVRAGKTQALHSNPPAAVISANQFCREPMHAQPAAGSGTCGHRLPGLREPGRKTALNCIEASNKDHILTRRHDESRVGPRF